MTPAGPPSFGGIPDAALEFYEGLEADNSRTYWTTHRADYERYVRDPMRALLADLAPEFGEGQVFRPHRDTRFSRDKSPYKSHQGAFVNVEEGVGYYVQIAAGGLLVAAGWHPQGEQILRFREAVLGPDGAALESVLATASAAGYTVGGDRLATRPRGQAPGHPREELTRHKSLEVSIDHGSPGWLGHPEAADRVAADWRALRPVVGWLQEHVGPGQVSWVPGVTWKHTRARVIRTAGGVGVATGAYGLSFGALATASGLSVLQACALSLLTFSGASQFALVGVIGTGGSPASGTASAILLGVRNGLYGVRLAPLLELRGIRRAVAAHLVIDESTAVGLRYADESPRAARLGVWATGLAVFVLWNLSTLVGAVAGTAIGDPRDFGLDAAVPAAFLALLAPRLRPRSAQITAVAAALVALAAVPLVPAGVPVLLAALVAVVIGLPTSWSRALDGGPP